MPQARSLILDLLSTLRPGAAMPVGLLVEAGAMFALSANNIRVALSRLLAAGLVARDERGHYRLGAGAGAVSRRVRGWRDAERRTRRWSGGWVAVHTGAAAPPAQRGRARALALLGFARLRPGLWLRPDNLAAPLDEVRAELAALGLPAGDLVCVLSALDAASEARARRLWDTAALRRTYRMLRAALTASEARLDGLGAERAMAESFVLGGRALRQLVLDPLLPEEICPGDERDALREQMRRYDRRGRQAWAELLQRWEVPSLRAPIDTRADVARRA